MSTFGELSQLELRKLDQSEATIDGLNVQIADTLSKIVQVTTNPAQAVQQEEAEKAKIEKANGKIVVLQKRFDEPERIEDASSFFSVFMQFTWPYVLIALLGLKIARVDYFSPPS